MRCVFGEIIGIGKWIMSRGFKPISVFILVFTLGKNIDLRELFHFSQIPFFCVLYDIASLILEKKG